MSGKLLPPAPSELERAASEIGAAALDVPVPIHLLKRPDEVPEALLPYLAWELSVDLWDEDWSTEKKRYVVGQSIELHRIKGTLEGISRHIHLVGGEVVGARVPPDGFYPGRARTVAEKAAYLGRFRQLRRYARRNRHPVEAGMFPGAGCYPGNAPVASVASAYAGVRSFVYDPKTGVEAPLTRVTREVVSTAGIAREVEETFIPFKPFGFYPGAIEHQSHIVDEDARTKVIRTFVDRDVTDTDEDVRTELVNPGGRPIFAEPRQVADRAPAQPGALFPAVNQFLRDVFLPPSRAPLDRYEVIYLHDPERAGTGGDGTAYLGHGRLGMPAYHAQINVRSTYPATSGLFVGDHLLGHFGWPQDRTSQIVDAAASATALRDKVWLRFGSYRARTLDDQTPLDGSRQLGEWIADTA